MRKKHRTKKSRSTNQSEVSFIQQSIFLIIMVIIAKEFNQIPNDVTSRIVFLVTLIVINVSLFRLMGIHQAFQRTHRIQNWKLTQRIIFGLYLFLTVLMVIIAFPYVELLYFALFVGLLFVVWRRYKNFNPFNSLSLYKIRFKTNHVTIEEIDKMNGTEFELFLSKLYEGLGYHTKVTPPKDFGIDVIISRDNITSGIQAKCYAEGRTVGVAAVNEVCGGAGVWKVHKKMVITNRYYTKEALITAKSNNVEMINREGLQLLLESTRK